MERNNIDCLGEDARETAQKILSQSLELLQESYTLHEFQASGVDKISDDIMRSFGSCRAILAVEDDCRLEDYTQEDDTQESACIVVVPKGASCKIFDSKARAVLLILMDGSSVEYRTTASYDDGLGLDLGCSCRVAILMEAAKLDWADASSKNGSALSYSVFLKGRGASVKYRSMAISRPDDASIAGVNIFHLAQNTESSMLSRQASLGPCKESCIGRVKISRNAKGSQARQHHDILMLKPGSVVQAKPILEVDNDDVRCSHGASVGKLPEEGLFYLRTRGIPDLESKKMMVVGFFDKMLIGMGEFGVNMRESISRRLDEELAELKSDESIGNMANNIDKNIDKNIGESLNRDLDRRADAVRE